MAEKEESKLNESYVSMGLGALVVLVIGVLIFNYFSKINKNNSGEQGKIQDAAQVSASPEADQKLSGTKPLSLSQTSSEQTYTVVRGDNLWKISVKFYGTGYNWNLIANANNLVHPRVIHAGNVLKIPSATVSTLPATGVVGSGASTTSSITGNSYVVAGGDTLWSIAVRAYGDGFAWNKISTANNNLDPRSLKVGMSLNLPR
jgi:nucleoid-associated protein YgaU